jgi:hypothetical protein
MSLGRGSGINKPAWMSKDEHDGPSDSHRSRSRSRDRDQFGRARGSSRDDHRRRCV